MFGRFGVGHHGFVTSIGVARELAVPALGRAQHRLYMLVGLGLAGAAATTVAVVTSPWFDTPFNRFTAIVSILPAWALPIGAWLLWRGRPSSRSAWLMFWLGATWTIWIGTGALIAHGVLGALGVVVQRIGVILLRPLIFWLLLSWPTGRLARGDARGIAVFAAISAIGFIGGSFALFAVLFLVAHGFALLRGRSSIDDTAGSPFSETLPGDPAIDRPQGRETSGLFDRP